METANNPQKNIIEFKKSLTVPSKNVQILLYYSSTRDIPEKMKNEIHPQGFDEYYRNQNGPFVCGYINKQPFIAYKRFDISVIGWDNQDRFDLYPLRVDTRHIVFQYEPYENDENIIRCWPTYYARNELDANTFHYLLSYESIYTKELDKDSWAFGVLQQLKKIDKFATKRFVKRYNELVSQEKLANMQK